MSVAINWRKRQSYIARSEMGKTMDKAWLKALGHMCYGIYVLTTADREKINGMIASWVSQVSYDPPLVSVAVHPKRYSHDMIQGSGHFALHLLKRDQRYLLQKFKLPNPASKFESLAWSRGETGCPILKECLAFMECKVRKIYNPGNHTLFIGQVVAAQLVSEEPPLTTLDYEGVYLGRE